MAAFCCLSSISFALRTILQVHRAFHLSRFPRHILIYILRLLVSCRVIE
jgi:hypothetical protein